MNQTYQPKMIEKDITSLWETQNYFKPQGPGEPYCIMLPPPNVTGTLHMGHGFQVTLMDTLIRYHRMCGEKTLWQPGTDHAGIATQMVVERQLIQEGHTRQEVGREAFVQKIWEWKEKSGGTIVHQLHRLGASCDWSRLKFTMDPDLVHAVHKAFVSLYDEGLIYRGKRLVNWDPVLHTAISDLEVLSEEEQGYLWYIRYPLSKGKKSVVIATTRPETMLADVAVAVHPEDERYQTLIGKTVILPLVNREIPIIADDAVDPTFGTGCVKITPAHDFKDYEMGKRHELPLINIFTEDAYLNENAPEIYRGLDRFEARKRIVGDLEADGFLEATKPHRLNIPRGDRTKTIIEPWLTDQWFVSVKPLVGPAIDAVKSGKIRFVPENWDKTYFQWLENAEDWCISRQLWWGHRIPAWYDEQGNIYVGMDEQEVRSKYHLPDFVSLTQDPDVLDTWFSSALWPFSTLGWPYITEDLKIFYPTHVLVTGFDIIFFWVVRMVMFGLKFIHDVPFKEVYITGLIRDSLGQKMSKSKGNTLDPLDLIDGIDLEALISKRTQGLMQPEMAKKIEANTRKEFPKGIPESGTDALRLTFLSLASPTRTINFSVNRLEGHRNFCNKLWNAARYILKMVVIPAQAGILPGDAVIPAKAGILPETQGDSCVRRNDSSRRNDNKQSCHPCESRDLTGITGDSCFIGDRWILSSLQRTIEKAHEYFKTYRFDLLSQILYDFTWHEFCDWYLEFTKPILTGSVSLLQKQNTLHTLIHVFETLLRLLHPLIPYVTESLWQSLKEISGKPGVMLMMEPYPRPDSEQRDVASEQEIQWIKDLVLAIRNIRGEMNISPQKFLSLFLKEGNATDRQQLERHETLLKALVKLDSISWIENQAIPSSAATAVVGTLEIYLPLIGHIDPMAESNRLRKEIQKLEKDLNYLTGKLANPDYLQKARPELIQAEQERVQELQLSLAKLKHQLEKVENIGC